MITKVKNSIIGRIKYLVLNLNEIDNGIVLQKTNKLKGSVLRGKVKIGANNEIINTNIFGNISLQSNSFIESSRLKGNVSIENNCKIYYCRIQGNVTIGKYTSLWGPNLDINSSNDFPVKIGNFCSIAKNLTIQTYNHNQKKITTYFIGKNIFHENWPNELVSKGGVEIKNDVWIGAECIILGGVTIGNGAIIAANSLVNKDVPDYAIVGGSPAKILGYRFNSEIIEKLLKLKWWNWDDIQIKKNKKLFEISEIDLSIIENLITKN